GLSHGRAGAGALHSREVDARDERHEGRLSEEVLRVVARDFAEAEHAGVQRELERYGDERWHAELARVRLAILELARGDATKLEACVALARTDYRDVLAWAEYPEQMAVPPPVPARAARAARLPPYAYVPGVWPHPTRDPEGHAYARRSVPVEPVDAENRR